MLSKRQLDKQACFYFFALTELTDCGYLLYTKKVFGKRVILETGVVNLSKVDSLYKTPSKIFRR